MATITITGSCSADRTRSSISSAVAGSQRCTSSIETATGCDPASVSIHARHAARTSCAASVAAAAPSSASRAAIWSLVRPSVPPRRARALVRITMSAAWVGRSSHVRSMSAKGA